MKNINLTDYIHERAYSRNETYTNEQIDTLLEILENKELKLITVVDKLPTKNIKTNHLYFLYNKGGVSGNIFDVYIYVNGNWERVDGLDFSLSDYYTINELDNLLRVKATKEDLIKVRNNLQITSDSLTTLYNNLIRFNEILIGFDEDNTNLSNDLSKLKDNLLIFITRVNQMIVDIDDLGIGLDDLNDGLDDAKDSIDALDDGLTNLGEDVTELGRDLTDTKLSLNTTKSKLQTTQNDLSDLSDELTETKNIFSIAQDNISDRKIQFFYILKNTLIF